MLGIEAFGERLGSPLDLVLRLHNEKGDVLTELDDVTDVQGPQFILRTDDPPYYRFSVPADGTYYLHVTSRESYVLAGPRPCLHGTDRAQEPDFRLVAMPPSSNDPSAALGTSGGVVLPVHVWRQEGFAGDVTLAGENLPPGLHVPSQRISATQKFGLLILTADATAAPYVGPITLVGHRRGQWPQTHADGAFRNDRLARAAGEHSNSDTARPRVSAIAPRQSCPIA